MVVHVATGLKRWDMILTTRTPTTCVIDAGPRGRIIFLTRRKKYGWGGGAQTMECLRQLREEREDVIEHLFQYIVQRLKSKIQEYGIAVVR